MDVIMQEYRTMPAGSPDYSLGSRRTMMQPGGQFNDAGRLGNMGMRQTLAAQAPTGTSPITPGVPAELGFRRPISEILASRDERTVAPMIGGDYNDVFNVPYTSAAAPLPPRIPGGQTRGVREPGFFERLFQGTDFQSNSMPVTMAMPNIGAVTPEYINYGDPNNAADFFRADRALMQQNPAMFGLLGGTNG
jgi:hypothetical protein